MPHTLTADGATISWTESGPGDGPMVVISHSLGSSSAAWEIPATSLEERFRVLRIDTRGHGASDSPTGPYTIEMLGSDVITVVDAAGGERFHICGQSIGGQIALWTAINHPDRVLSLIACNTAARIGTAERWGARIEAVRQQGLSGISTTVASGWFTPGFEDRHPDRFAAVVGIFETTDPEAYIACCQALQTADLRGEVASISLPTLLIAGNLDRSTPPSEVIWLHGQIAQSEMTIFEDAAHLPNLEHPDAFTGRLVDFLGAQYPQTS